MQVPRFVKLLAVATISLQAVSAVQAAEITGAGATFPYPIYAKWAEAYKQASGTGMNYQSIGSGGGKFLRVNPVVLTKSIRRPEPGLRRSSSVRHSNPVLK